MRLNIDKEHKELKAHGNYAFPVLVSDERLSWFDTGEFPWHWHPEIELTIVLDGNMTYLVNDNEYILRAGEGLFCNTNVLHSGRHYDADCPEEPEENGRDIERIRTLMEYMQKHYGEKVTLEELADQIHLCKSESCRLFKRYMKESLFDYLLA